MEAETVQKHRFKKFKEHHVFPSNFVGRKVERPLLSADDIDSEEDVELVRRFASSNTCTPLLVPRLVAYFP